MRHLVIWLAIIGPTIVHAQTPPLYRVTRTMTLGGDGELGLHRRPIRPTHRVFIGRQDRVMVVDDDRGTLIGEVTGINGAHGTAIAERSRPWLRDLRQRSLSRDVRPEDVQSARPHSRGRRRRRDHLRSRRRIACSRSMATRTRRPSSIRRPASCVTNMPLGGKPEYGVSAGDGKVYANLTDTSEVVEIDAKALDGLAPLVDRPLQAAGGDGDRHGAPSAVQRLPQRRDGGVGLSGGKVVATRSDRRRRRRRRLRSGVRRRVCVERRRHADRHSPGHAGSVSRRRNAADCAGIAKHGARPDDASHLHRRSEVRAGAGGRPGARPRPARFVRSAGRRAIALAADAETPHLRVRGGLIGGYAGVLDYNRFLNAVDQLTVLFLDLGLLMKSMMS